MNLDLIGKSITRLAGRQALTLQKHSPEILLVTGIAGILSSTVMACRATLKVEEVLQDHNDKVQMIEQCMHQVILAEIPEDKYTEHDRKKDLTTVYTQTVVKFARLYGPPVILGVASIGCIVQGHTILRSRNVALMAAYKAVDSGFKAYRQRVVDEFGEEKDYMLRHNLRAVEVVEEETGENGKTRMVKKTKLEPVGPLTPSVYARLFDECCLQWSPEPMYNLMLIRAQQNYFNDLLKVQGHVFLNEVYDALGMDRTPAGAVVGWIFGKGDSYIDFGVYDGDTQPKRDFVNGYERNILLDFNVDGVIWDLIKK